MFVWFCFGYAIAFGTDPSSTNVQFGGFNHGYFADLSGNVEKKYLVETDAQGNENVNMNIITNQEIIDKSLLHNQRRFYLAFAFQMVATNIATSSVAERVQMTSITYFVILQQLFITPIILCWSYAKPYYSDGVNGGVGFLYNFGFFDRAGAIVVLYSGALIAMVSCAVVGPRYGVFMPIEDQQKISGGGKESRKGGLTALLQGEKDKAFEIDEIYLYKIRKLIKRELIEGNTESGTDVAKLIVGTFTFALCLCAMNSIGLNPPSLFTKSARYNANLGFVNSLLSGSVSGLLSYVFKKYVISANN